MSRAAVLLSILATGLFACGDPGTGVSGDAAINIDAPMIDGGVVTVDAAPPDGGTDPGVCEFYPSGEFNPDVECSWLGPAPESAYQGFDDVVSTPVVINLTDDDGDGDVDLDDIPDVAFISYPFQKGDACPAGAICGCCDSSGVLRVVSGACEDGTLAEHFSVGDAEIEAATGMSGVWLDSSGGLAAGDIDGDGSVDLVATTRLGGTIAFERDGRIKWYQPDYPTGPDHHAGTQPAIADLNGDGHPEVIQGRVVLSGEDGALVWQGTAGLGDNAFLGPVSVVSDLDLDGKLNVLAGNTMYDEAGTPLWSYTYADSDPACQQQADPGEFPCDGFTAAGNLDGDDEGEVVITRAGVIYALNDDGSPLLVGGKAVEIPLPGTTCEKNGEVVNEGGPPTVADFDGDGEVEIGVAGAEFYVVADLECLADPLPAECSDPGIRWKVPNKDCSSRVTGSSVFDFDGDGKAEVIYNDEQHFRIFDGVTGQVKLEIENHSHTRLEMPIVADVDNDGNAEIVFIENAGSSGTTQGIRVWGDATDSWVPTRRVWNQHSYHITNVSELGAIPASEPVNWLTATTATPAGVFNNFRQNLGTSRAAPDLTIAIEWSGQTCKLTATVCNEGDLRVGPGIPVTFYDQASEAVIACKNDPLATTGPLAPGACETLTCDPVAEPAKDTGILGCVDNAGFACESGVAGGQNECDEADNSATVVVTGCSSPE